LVGPKVASLDCRWIVGCIDSDSQMILTEKLIRGEIIKPTGKRDEKLTLDGEYKIEWQNLADKLKYFIVQVKT